LALAVEEWIGPDQQRACSQLTQSSEHGRELTIGARMEDMEFESECGCRSLQVSRLARGIGIGRIDNQGHDGRRRHHLVQQLQPLRP
jgi:hypothetical protein